MASTTVNFNLKTAGFANYANQTLTFRLLTAGADKTDDSVTLAGVVTATSAANGTGSVALFRNGDSDIASVFEVIFPNREKAQFIIPVSTSSIHLSDLLVDHVPGGSNTQQSSVYAAAIQRANHTGTQALSTISDASTVQLKPSEGAFANGDKTKLDAIEASADVTDTTNVTAAGALMDSELTSIANVKALNQSLVSGAAPTFTTTNMTDASGKRFMSEAQETKLDSIAAGAGVNLTNNEIRDAVEAADDSNTFTNDDHTKLNNIEASADVTDTANVTSAGALMDSEVANLAFVKTLTGGISNGNVLLANAAVSDNDFLKIDGTSVEGRTAAELRSDLNVENGADVTDTTNVTAAGALMDSELADLTGVKTLLLPDSTTISDFSKTFLDDADAAAVKSTLGIADTSAIAGFVPNSITFPTTSDFLSIADSADLDVGTSDFTLSFWARLDGTGTEPILNKFSTAGYSLKFSSGSLILTIQGTGDPLAVTLATGLNDNKWHVYVVTVDRDGNAVAYIDNIAQTGVSVSTIQSSLDNTTAFRIGFDGANAGSGIALGNYVVLHKEALDATEAAQIYFSADTALTVGSPLPSLMVDLRKADKTFTDVSASPLAIVTNGSIRFNQDRITSLDGATIGATTPAAVTGTAISGTSIAVTGTAGTVKLPSLTTTQRDALTAAVGMLIYNSTTSKIQARAGSAWVDLH